MNITEGRREGRMDSREEKDGGVKRGKGMERCDERLKGREEMMGIEGMMKGGKEMDGGREGRKERQE